MAYDKPPTPVIERLLLVPDSGPTIVCRCCGDTMKHFRTIPRLGIRPKQFMFRCPSCKGVDTKELKRVA
jgi:hypothetical protein